MTRSLILLPLLLLGCDSLVEPGPNGGLALIPYESSYRKGEVAEARLVNDSYESIGYNVCLAIWDLRVDGEWQRMVPLRMCPQAIYTLDPGAETLLREPIDDTWRPGTYRFVLDVRLMGEDGGSATVISGPFEVRN